MQSAEWGHNIQRLKNSALNAIEDLIALKGSESDAKTPFYYSYKPYPAQVKSAQLNSWVALQQKTLMPFQNGGSYVFASKNGLCFWAAPNEVEAPPETAIQGALEDGVHFVKGQHHSYEQIWKNGVMLACDILPDAGKPSATTIALPKANIGWAQSRIIDTWLSSPAFWSLFVLLSFSLIATWLLVSSLAINNQSQALDKISTELEYNLGDTLITRSNLDDQISVVDTLTTWRAENGYLPQAMADVMDVVLKQSEWQANRVTWQSKSLNIELLAKNLDITRLVQDLESLQKFSEVSVRPHSQKDTWNIEVVIDE